jgi:NAD(P)-dependent dehydrogenase (short-subunit alcohol dehydrogenase family)
MSKLNEVEAAGIETLKLDVTSDSSIADCVSRISDLTATDGRGPSLDALINNAGLVYRMPIVDSDMNRVRELFDGNFFPIISLSQAFLPLLLNAAVSASRDNADSGWWGWLSGQTRRPVIVNNTSIGCLQPGGAVPWQGVYSATKSAVAQLTETMRLELAPLGIDVVNLCTGMVTSRIFANDREKTGAKLPKTSVYYDISKDARAAIEEAMTGAGVEALSCDARPWAANVVRDVDRANPPRWIFRGNGAGIYGTITTVLPWLSELLTQFHRYATGVVVLERAIRDRGGITKLKIS